MIAQIGIALFGVIAVWLSQSPDEGKRRYACIFGLAGQPFWFWAAFSTKQWGILALCFLYTVSWARGFKLSWIGRGK